MIFFNRQNPILCFYYITYRCNARCTFCDIWQRQDLIRSQDASFEDIKRNIPQLKKLGVKFIDFTGGEPLLYSYLPDALFYAKQHSLFTTVTSNGILYSDIAEEIRGLVDFLHFSLDGATPETNDTIRGRATFHHVMDSLELALSLDENPDILYTATPDTIAELPKLVRMAQELRVMLIVNPVFEQNDDLTAASLQMIEQFKNVPFVYVNRAFHQLRREGGNQAGSPRCRAVSSCIVISPDNNLLLPCFHHHQSSVPIDRNLFQAFNSPQRHRFLHTQGRHSFCQGCTINCYFDPTFLYRFDRFFIDSQVSKIKYGIDKYLRGRARFPLRSLNRLLNPFSKSINLNKAA